MTSRVLGEVRDVSFASGDTEIHGYVTLPAGFDPANATRWWPNIHGGPVYQHSHEFDLAGSPLRGCRLRGAGDQSARLIRPRLRFFPRHLCRLGQSRCQDISAGITHAIESGIADPDRIGVPGGAMAASSPIT